MDEEILAKVKKSATIGIFFAAALVFFLERWYTALVVYALVVGLFATLAILIQSGKGGGLAASLGGLGGESLLGVRSATPIAKATYVMLALFLVICMLTSIMGPSQRKGKGLLETAAPPTQPLNVPEMPAGGAVPPLGQPAPAEKPATPAEKPASTAPAEKPAATAPAAPAASSTKPEGTQKP